MELTQTTLLMESARAGGRSALERLTPLLYDDLRKPAASMFRREQPGDTRQPMALVNEACLRLLSQHSSRFNDRAHFLALAV